MADLFKTLSKAARLVRKGRPMSALIAMQDGLKPTAAPRTRLPKAPRRKQAKPAAARQPRPAPGTFGAHEFDCRHGAIHFRLYTPRGPKRRNRPLVVMLHGCSQTASDFATGTGMNELADELGCLVLYPQQSQRANLARCWNWHRPRNQARGEGEPALIAALTRHVLAIAAGNSERVFIAGISAGGSAAAIVGAAYPDLFIAVGVHSGVARGTIRTLPSALAAMRGDKRAGFTGRATRPLPTIVFHGDEDRVVHPSNAAGFLNTLERSQPGPLISRTYYGKSDKGRDFTRKVYRSSSGNTLLEDWTIHGSGHEWSGGSASASYTDPLAPNASREMMRFFLSQRRAN
ncbi:PHB depolymerase family esterase [Novosphingobium resinovorum]|uniref:extracellular catalytic domain type 1 short-chain-length polyhydroxyalkanoate depolymerase n=1 Tax=Novosphingobium TaxID=165696 RepID=UPI001B3C765C|nr:MULTISPECIES: PHB depolymerase family esterase [Novosphingobium]MBF7012630.1 PHB depolymerase family esterase [Novosphingobium sp. HR1a]WJM27363.1 PHB depolymerase family esterase [Novosphingobium resinovorum]